VHVLARAARGPAETPTDGTAPSSILVPKEIGYSTQGPSGGPKVCRARRGMPPPALRSVEPLVPTSACRG
jgi:hypothetical protein